MKLHALGLLALTVALAACTSAPAQQTPIAQGLKYVMATHSFNAFIGPTRPRDPNVEVEPGPLAALAAERGKTGHEALAVQMILSPIFTA